MILGLLFFSPSVRADTLTAKAELAGVVLDGGSNVLPNATVEVVSGKLRITQVTGPDGAFHFFCLPGGEFRITFTHPLATRAGEVELTMSPPSRYWIDAEMSSAGMGVWALREDSSHEGGPVTSTRTYTRQEVERLPSALNLWNLIGHIEVSATAERFDIAGMHSDETMLLGSRGGSWSQNSLLWNGFNLTRADGAGALFLPDLSAVQSVTYHADPPGISVPGSELALAPRVGGSARHGEVQLFLQSGALQNVNVTPRLRSFGITESDERHRHFAQSKIQLGGPLSSSWTCFGAVSAQHAEKWIRNHTLPVTNALTTGTANVIGDISPRDRINFILMGQYWHQPYAGASSQVAREATRDIARSFQVLQGSWTRVFSPRSLLDVRAAFLGGNTDAALQPGTNQPSRVQLFPSSVDIPLVPSAEGGRPIVALLNNVFTGAAPLATMSFERRFEGQSAFSTFLSGPSQSSHRLSTGADVVWLRVRERANAFQNINLRFFHSEPDSVQAVNSADARVGDSSLHLYATDQISLGAFSLSLSAQGGWTRGRNLGVSGAEQSRLRWRSAGMHAGAAYRIGFRHPAVLRASVTQRAHEAGTRALEAVHPGGLRVSTYSWSDFNQDGSFQAAELGTLLKVEGAPFSRMNPRIQRPFTREVHFEAVQAVPWKISLSVHGYRRVEHKLLGFLNTGVPESAFAAVSVFDPGNDGASQTGDETLRIAYNQDLATLGRDAYLLTNPLDAGGFAEGYEARIRQNTSRLQWELAFTRYRAVAHTAYGNGPLENDWAAVAVYNDPNQSINAYGSTYFDRGLGARFWGTYRLPWAVQLGWIGVFLDGAPYGRILPVTGLDQGLTGIFATRRGPGDGSPGGGKRTAHNATMDLRISRDFQLRHGRLVTSIDVFNLANSAFALREAEVTSPTHLWRIPLSFQTPRSLQLGARYSW